MAEKMKNSNFFRNKKLWIIIPSVVVFILIVAFLAYYFYFVYYMKPGFEQNEFNVISASQTGEVKPGDQIDYSIDFKNTGNIALNDLVIKTKIPGNTEFVSSDPNGRFNQTDKSIDFSFGELASDSSGNVKFSVAVVNPLDNGTKIKAEEVVFKYSARDVNETFTISDTPENTVTSSPVFNGFKASIIDINEGLISMGDDLSFKITLKNSGDMNARNIKVINRWPDKFELYEDSVDPEAQVDRSSNKIIWNLETLEADRIRTFAFKARVGNGFEHLESFKNIIQVEYEGEVKNEIVLEDSVAGFPNFSESTNTVVDADGGSVWAGDTLKYTILLKNTGLRDGENFRLVCPIPEYTSFLSGSANPSEGANYSSDTDELIWEVASLGVGEEKTFTFNVAISSSLTSGGTIQSVFYIEGDNQYFELEPLSIGVRSYIFQTVVCMGDSQIVYTNWPAGLDHLLESSYPRAEWNTISSGVAQERAHQGARRFDSTVAPYGPQIVVIGYGTNDVGADASLFRNGMNDLINKAKGIGATVIVHGIGWIDTNKHELKKAYNSYNSILRDICAKQGVPYVDIAGPMSGDPRRYVSGDGIHWTAEGGNLVASLVFNTLRNYLDAEGNRK
jgi:uncharacterized repeat protein (TIGR01451 family)